MKTKSFLTILTAVQLHFAASSFAAGDYVAHEWGTFTSVQGADGIQLEWNPLTVAELPKFVYDSTKPSGDPRRRLTLFAAKTAFRALQRMETPVIYFYSEQERTVDVTVNFPDGRITEWYPQAHEVGPSAVTPRPLLAKADELATKAGFSGANFSSLDTRKSISESVIRWTDIKVMPVKEHGELESLMPADPSGSHYYAARETDADFVRVNGETEKFLFYRGIGNFRAPLTVTQSGGDSETITLQNTGQDELRHLFLYSVQAGQGKFLLVDKLAPGTNRQVQFVADRGALPLPALRARLAAELQDALVAEGLFPREAAAMVKTWNDSWFAEQGLRVLYVLPRDWTDRILPLTLHPKPAKLVRVMVGRAEMITSGMEWNLMKQIVRYIDADDAGKVKATEAARALGLGRFLEPATRRLIAMMPNRELSQRSWEFLQAANRPPANTKELAGK